MYRGKKVIQLIGLTGAGKSTTGSGLLRALGDPNHPFLEAFSAKPCTNDPQVRLFGDVAVVDNPGMMDPRKPTGRSQESQDSKNLYKMVEMAREIGHLNMLLLVASATNSRLDKALLDALDLIVVSFGRGSLNHLYVAFTNCLSASEDALVKLTNEWCVIINDRCHTNLSHLSHFKIENHPERCPYLKELGIQEIRDATMEQFELIVATAKSETEHNTKKAEFGVLYEDERRVRDAEAETKIQKNQVELEREKRMKAEAGLEEARARSGSGSSEKADLSEGYKALGVMIGIGCAMYKNHKEGKPNPGFFETCDYFSRAMDHKPGSDKPK